MIKGKISFQTFCTKKLNVRMTANDFYCGEPLYSLTALRQAKANFAFPVGGYILRNLKNQINNFFFSFFYIYTN